MRWLLAGYCGLALIYISVAQKSSMRITQKPRFYGMTTSNYLYIVCNVSQPLASAKWYRAEKYNGQKEEIKPGDRMLFNLKLNATAVLLIRDLRVEDSGVYFCQIDDKWGSGTEIQVVRPKNYAKAQYRTKMKDGLIVLQGLMLAVFIGALLLRKQKLLEKKEIIYEEPETDHIYEGLTIETCGGGLYEELSVYAQAEGAEAPWE